MKIHLWAPELAQGGGGIEAYSSFVLKALVDSSPNLSVRVVTKHDTTKALAETLPQQVKAKGVGGVPLPARALAMSVLALAQVLRHRPDLIIITHLNFSPLAGALLRRLGIRYWVSLHGVEGWNLDHPTRQQGLRDAAALLPVSRYTRDVVAREQGIPLERFRLLPNAFDPSAFNIGPKPEYLLKRYGLTPGQPVILTVGRLSSAERYKGHDRVLRVLKDVAEQSRKLKCESRNVAETWKAKLETRNSGVQEQIRDPQSDIRNSDASDLRSPRSGLRYVIVGDGDDRARLEKLADELDVRDLVIFAGKVPAEELCDHYNLCDLFAMPSTGEGFGIVFLEALACGKPVIAGNKDASRDAILDGELGMLVDPDNLQELTEALVAVLAEVKSLKSKVESNGPTSDLRPESSSQLLSPSSELPAPCSPLRIPEIVFQPEALRAKVIEHFGYEKFKETLHRYLEEFFQLRKAEGEPRKLNI